MVQAGLTPMQVIQSFSRNAAEALGAASLGTLEPGKAADLIVLDSDPLKDIRNTRAYASELAACGLKITERRSLGVRFWFAAGPWAATRLVAAIKP